MKRSLIIASRCAKSASSPEDFQAAGDLAQLAMVDRSFVKENNALFRSSKFPDELCIRLDSGSGSTTFWDIAASQKRLSIAPCGRTRQLYLLPDTGSSLKVAAIRGGKILRGSELLPRRYPELCGYRLWTTPE
jgi:hypothetical protein